MRRECWGLFCVVIWVLIAATAKPADAADEKCALRRVAEIPVTMAGTRPLITGAINGNPARFLADSGAFFSLLTRESATRHGLKVVPLPSQLIVRGVGGSERMKRTEVPELVLTGFAGGRTFAKVDFLVGGNQIRGDIDGIIGQNFLGRGDTEYDLANGFIRVFQAESCKGVMLAYWARGETQVAELKFRKRTADQPLLIASARLNGKRIRVLIDSGASRSVLTLRAAARAGIEPEDERVSADGLSRGIGKRTIESSVALFDTLDLGGELIKNARLRLGDIQLDEADMLLGADFFLSHRLYIDSRASKMYFTYNGGPVFDLSSDDDAAPTPLVDIALRESPEDSASLRRRGAASAGRRDFAGALADLDRAIQIDPSDVESYYQRALVHAQTGRALQALADLDQALTLKPDHLEALMRRGAVRLLLGNDAGASDDFAAAQRLSPDSSELPLEAARAFGSAGKSRKAIAQLDGWLERFPKHERVPDVLHGRCRLRAVANLEPELALADCNLALKRGSRSSVSYNSRALVHLRLGSHEQAVDDYDEALDLQPRDASSLYGRGLAELRQGRTEQGEASLEAALAIDARVAEEFAKMGLTR
jgi:tetratricopeptide (TPR) repeat protein/predicted aspartyl protease